MAIDKVMGIETEYGIISRGPGETNPILASSLLINSFAAPPLKEIQWDYEEESPLRDARGFDRAGIDQLEEDGGLVSVILENGARYYVDHAHPEYSTPECTNARDLVIHDKAGEKVLKKSIEGAAQIIPDQQILVYKNNSDGKGNSYGCHENYLMSRETPFANIAAMLMPFLVSRQIFTGAGKVGSETGGSSEVEYQISQRADFFEVEVGLETTFKRPIVNTRDEPHADPEKYRRLHVIIGDANMSEISTFLKVGTTALILKMIEDDFITDDLTLAEPVTALKTISRDPTCRTSVQRSGGGSVTALELQWEFFDWTRKYLASKEIDETTASVLERWEGVLEALESDPMQLADQLDWVAKKSILQAYQDKHSLKWDDPKLALVDLQYHDVRETEGIYNKLAAQGRIQRLVTDEEVLSAISEPPEDTRAWFRGKVLGRFSESITTASWDTLVFDTGSDVLRKMPMLEPLRGTRELTEGLLASVQTAEDLVERLQN